MGDSMITVLTIVAIIVGIGTIFTAVWIAACLYQANKREKIILCSCGKKPPLHWKEADYKEPKKYAYICSCGVQGYMGLTEEEAFYGWDFRGNYQAYIRYIEVQHANDEI